MKKKRASQPRGGATGRAGPRSSTGGGNRKMKPAAPKSALKSAPKFAPKPARAPRLAGAPAAPALDAPPQMAAGATLETAPVDERRRQRQAALDARKQSFEEARTHLREIEALIQRELVDDAGRSPFAPRRFPDLPPIDGVRLSAAAAGVRYSGRDDVMLGCIDPGASLAGLFTTSRTRAAPVIWCEETLEALGDEPTAGPVALLVNSGNANAFTGQAGIDSVATLAARAVDALNGVSPDPAVGALIASTGVIGEQLPAHRIVEKLDDMAADLGSDAWEAAARAIMTTDTYPKGASLTIEIGGAPVRITGVAKGSGMIAPDMATMLAFVFTDACVAPPLLRRLLTEANEDTFNAITVDGDTSTSDTLIAAATNRANHPMLHEAEGEDVAQLRRGLRRVLRQLAHQVVRDGEGVSKFVEVQVTGAQNKRAARTIGMAVCNSPLVKTAWAGEDPNWGRIVMAVGKSGEVAHRDKLMIQYGDHLVAENGQRAADYDEDAVAMYMRNPELTLKIDVGAGPARFTVWSCDLTQRYVSINADYRS